MQTQQPLDLLRSQYFQLLDPRSLAWPDENTLKQSTSQRWLYENLFAQGGQFPLPPDRYQLRVLKILVNKLEVAATDPDEDVGLPSSSRAVVSSNDSARSTAGASYSGGEESFVPHGSTIHWPVCCLIFLVQNFRLAAISYPYSTALQYRAS
jgi:hypothetical protein